MFNAIVGNMLAVKGNTQKYGLNDGDALIFSYIYAMRDASMGRRTTTGEWYRLDIHKTLERFNDSLLSYGVLRGKIEKFQRVGLLYAHFTPHIHICLTPAGENWVNFDVITALIDSGYMPDPLQTIYRRKEA